MKHLSTQTSNEEDTETLREYAEWRFKKSDSEKKVATDTLKMLENNKLEINEEKSLLKKIIDSLIR